MTELETLAWNISDLNLALTALLEHATLTEKKITFPPIPQAIQELMPNPKADPEPLSRWLDLACREHQVHLESYLPTLDHVFNLLSAATPFLLLLPYREDLKFLAVASGGRSYAQILGSDGNLQEVEQGTLRLWLLKNLNLEAEIKYHLFFEKFQLSAPDRIRILDYFFKIHLSTHQTGWVWKFKPSPSKPIRTEISRLSIPWFSLKYLGIGIINSGLGILTWGILARWVSEGRFDKAGFLGWTLIVVSTVFFQFILGKVQIDLIQRMSVLMKRRILEGSLRLLPDETKETGMGKLISQMISATSLENLAVQGGMTVFATVIQIGTTWILIQYAQVALATWVAIALWMGMTVYTFIRVHGLRSQWNGKELQVDPEAVGGAKYFPQGSILWLIESMVETIFGQRTRKVQESPGQWHQEEDEALAIYLSVSQRLDFWTSFQVSVLPKGGVILVLASMAPELLWGRTASAGSLALLIFSVLQLQNAVLYLSLVANQLSQGLIYWQQLKPTWVAAARRENLGAVRLLLSQHTRKSQRSISETRLVEMVNASFSFRNSKNPAVNQCSGIIEKGDRILLQGPSGGGKSTLASLITGNRPVDSGKLSFYGIELKTWGSAHWRRKLALVPQFHENYIFSDTFEFNLLMARRWPPTREDLKVATEVCQELGLEDLIKKMANGTQQILGDTGWQLSHGERTRVCLARALLQDAELIVLDESLGTLDPDTRKKAFECILKRAKTVMVIAHP